MNTINVKVNFTRGTCEVSGINLITGDYNSTKMVFTFDREDGTKIFEMKSPSEQLVMVQEIENNEIILYGEDENENIASIFSEDGYYIFEISLYENDSKLTSASGKIKVKPEQVVIDGEVVEAYLPVFDQLLSEVSTALTETSNLDIEVSKSGSVATITLTDKEGTTHTTNINDGVSLEDMEIDDGDLKVTYGGDTENLGQVVPNIQVGTTTTLSPGASASVTNVGTELNPILNFAIPKGEAGAIKIVIVAELPETGVDDTIYLVPLENPTETGNNYAEYVYINNAWELLGKIGVHVDLTDYVKNTDYATSSKGGTIKTGYGLAVNNSGNPYAELRTYANYQSVNDNLFIGKGTLENVITGKGLVSNTDYANSSTAGVIKVVDSNGFGISGSGALYTAEKTYAQYSSSGGAMAISKTTLENVLTEKIGSIDSVLDAINGEVI